MNFSKIWHPDMGLSQVIHVQDDMLIQDVVQIMVDKGISSVLVCDKKDHVVGIMTERDIVRKFTLLPIQDKMTRTVGTIMTRGVKFITPDKIEPQIIELHLKEKIRHFPVLTGDEPLLSHVLGILTITDFLRQYLLVNYKNPNDIPPTEPKKIPLKVMALDGGIYQKFFSSLGFEVYPLKSFSSVGLMPTPVLFDLDGLDQKTLKSQIPMAIKYKGRVVFTTSNPTLIAPFRLALSETHHTISLKPIDLSYIVWFFSMDHPLIGEKSA
jgi:CBS domain-containing protein